MSADVFSEDGYFAVIPEWVLDAPISAQAVRLYAVLRRYADQRTMHAHPSRKTLRDRMKVRDEKTVDRALAELEKVSALVIVPRFTDDGDRAANGYRLLRQPVSQESGVGAPMPPPPPKNEQGGGAHAPRGGGTHAPTVGAQEGEQEPEPLEREPEEPEKNFPAPPQDADEGALIPSPTALTPKPRRRTSPGDPPGFAAFWQTYPRAEDKGDARKVWQQGGLEDIADVVVAGAIRYRDDPNRDDAYTRKPRTWLQGECWSNGPLPQRAPQSKTEAENQYQDQMWNAAWERAVTRDAANEQAAIEGASIRAVGGSW